MRMWARVIARIPSISTLSPIEILDEFGRAIFAQLDFRIEANNNRRFRTNFKGHARRRLPRGRRGASRASAS